MWIVIGISGPTCCGKTSVAKKIHANLKNSIILNQDKYFFLNNDPRHVHIPELNHVNYDILSSLDMPKMYSDARKIIDSTSTNLQENTSKEKKFLIIEGFLIFQYKPIVDFCHKKYFIDANREICWKRRCNRIYDPVDVPGYFDMIVWPQYLKYKSEILSNETLCKDIQFLDGSLKNIEELSKEVLTNIQALV